MTITFEHDSDVIVYGLEKIISFARDNQYLFVANCVWWIAGIIGLDTGLQIHIANLECRKVTIDNRAISETPRDIARGVSPEEPSSEYIPEPLWRVWKGRINPLPQSKNPLKKARKVKRQEEAKKAEELKFNGRLGKLRTQIIKNLSKE
jgi:hypothetical protein